MLLILLVVLIVLTVVMVTAGRWLQKKGKETR